MIKQGAITVFSASEITAIRNVIGSGHFAVVSSFSNLASFDDTGATDGYVVYVQSLRSYFFRKAGALVGSDGITYTNSNSGTAVWYRDLTPNRSWALPTVAANWYVNGSSGNDENDGISSGTPLKTLGELSRRLNLPEPISKSSGITINMLSSTVDDDFLRLDLAPGAFVTINGTTTVNASASVTAVTPRNKSTNQREVTTAGIAWASPRLLHNVEQNAYGYIAATTTGGSSQPTALFTNSTEINTANGNTLEEITLFKFGANVEVRGGPISFKFLRISTNSVNLDPVNITCDAVSANNIDLGFDRCIFEASAILDCHRTDFARCLFTQFPDVISSARITFRGCVLKDVLLQGFTLPLGIVFNTPENYLVGSSSIQPTNSLAASRLQVRIEDDLAFVDTPNDTTSVIALGSSDIVEISGAAAITLWGSGNRTLFNIMRAGGLVTYASTTSFFADTGAHTNWIMGTRSGAWAALPVTDLEHANFIISNVTWPESTTELIVADRTTLSALNVTTLSLPDGIIARTTNIIAKFRLEKTSPSTVDGINILTATTGRWVRVQEPMFDYINQSTWYVDYTSGNDENTGLSSGTAIKTFQEWYARTQGRFQLVQTLNLIGTSWPFSDRFHYTVVPQVPTGGSTGVFTIQGQQIVSRSGTTTSNSTNPVTTAGLQEFSTIIDTAVSSWTGDVGKLIVAANGSFAWVLKDIGSNTARVTSWATVTGATAAAPPSGTAYNIVSLTSLIILPQISTQSDIFAIVNCENATALRSFSSKTFWEGCKLNFGVDMSLQGTFVTCLFNSATWNFSTQVGFGTVNPTQCLFGSCGFLNSDITWSTGLLEIQDSCFQNGHILMGRTPEGHSGLVGNAVGVLSGTYGVGLFDAAAANPAIVVDGRSNLFIGESLFGKSNLGVGTSIRRGSAIYIKGTVPTLASVGTELLTPSNPIPALTPGASVPATSTLTTWSALNASPFSGEAFTCAEWCHLRIA